MSDITRFIIDKAVSLDQLYDVQVILGTVESGLSTEDDEFKNLILASFIESLFGKEMVTTKNFPMMMLRAEVMAMRVI